MSGLYDGSLKAIDIVDILICRLVHLIPALRYFFGFTLIFLVSIIIYCLIFVSFPDTPTPNPKRLDEVNIFQIVNKNFEHNTEVLFEEYPKVSKELNEVVDLIVEHFVMVWFQRVDVDNKSNFPTIVKNLVRKCIQNLQAHISKTDVTKVIILKLIPLVTKHINTYWEANEFIMNKQNSTLHKFGNLELQIAVEFNKRYNIHHALSLRASKHNKDIEIYLRNRVKQFLPYIVNSNELKSPYVSVLLREIILSSVLVPLIIKFSNADNWNLKIIALSEKILEERKQVHEIKRILLQEIDDADVSSKSQSNYIEGIVPKYELNLESSLTKFEEYIKQISGISDIKDLRVTFFTLLTKISKISKKAKLTKQEDTFKNRLQLSLNLVGTRLSYLNEQMNDDYNDSRFRSRFTVTDINKTVEVFETLLNSISLDDLMYCETFILTFKHYLSSQPRKAGETFLNYWEVIEKLRTPLEDANSKDLEINFNYTEIKQLQNISRVFFTGNNLLYVNQLDAGLVKNVLLFHSHQDISESIYLLARKSMLFLQLEAKRILEREYFWEFKDTELFLRLLANPEFQFTGVYYRFFGKETENSKITLMNNNSIFNPVRAVSESYIDNALEDILNNQNTKYNYNLKFSTQTGTTRYEHTENSKELYKDFLVKDINDNSIILPIRRHSEALQKRSSTGGLNDTTDVQESIKSDSNIINIKDEIGLLTISSDQCEKKLNLLSHLLLKAELTDNQKQLKILKNSKRSLMKELENNELLRQQYLIQENENRLFNKTKVYIKSYYCDNQPDTWKDVTYYILTVKYFSNKSLKTWEIPRRFSEFVRLNSYLTKNFKLFMTTLQNKELFPQKITLAIKYHVSKYLLYEQRQIKLEFYIRSLLNIPEICDDNVFKKFITDSSPFLIRGDILTNEQAPTSNQSKLQVKLYDNYPEQLSHENISVSSGENASSNFAFDEYSNNIVAENENNLQEHKRPFIKPICDFFIALFSLTSTDGGWLRGRAIITVLRRLLGSTIDKYVSDSIKRLHSEEVILEIVGSFRNSLWGPDGSFERRKRGIDKPRKAADILKSRTESRAILKTLLIELSGKVVGLKNSREAAIKIHGVLQNRYLNTSLLLQIIDLVLDEAIIEDSKF